MRKLKYYVYAENINQRKIKPYNVLNDGILQNIEKRCKLCDVTDKVKFAAHVEAVLMSHYWSRSEWEIILTDSPTHITTSELERLNKELEEDINESRIMPLRLCTNLSMEEKIDVYDQIMLNWNIFVDYLWNNWGKNICKRKRSKDE